jgi:AcrR family transcriptional regulator
MAARSSSSPRRTQAERSALTRARILDAALACLAELGYAATTTTVVAERAGVSRGAQLHHFPTRDDLVAAAVRHLFADLREAFQKAFAALSPEADRVGAAIDLLWEVYRDPRLAAVLELYVAGRTDASLRARLAPVAAAHHAHVVVLARAYFPEAAARAGSLESVLDLVLDTLQGMAVRRVVHGDVPELETTRHLLASIARGAIAPAVASASE